MDRDLATIYQQKTIRKVFDQRSDFIVIGLVGAVDSGLEYVADILSRDFEDLNLYEVDCEIDDNIQRREHKIIYDYAKHHWKRFDVIKARDVIITYILENKNTYKRFCKEIGRDLLSSAEFFQKYYSNLRNLKIDSKEYYVDIDEIKEGIDQFLDRCLEKGLYVALLERNNELADYIIALKSKTGTSTTTRTTLSLYIYTKYILPVLGQLIKEFLEKEKYTTLFQRYGNEIRFFGTLDMKKWKEQIENIENLPNFDYFYSIAKRINTFIKIRRAPTTDKKSVPTQIVIDSLKNPYEISFLKDRYSAYYTFALPEKHKKETVGEIEFKQEHYSVLFENPSYIKKDFGKFITLLIEYTRRNENQIDRQDYNYVQALETPNTFMEYILGRLEKLDWDEEGVSDWCPEIRIMNYSWEFENFGILEDEYSFFFTILKDPIRTFCMISGLYLFYLQDIQSSIQSADVFLGSLSDIRGKTDLTYQIVRYVSLIMHPGLVLPTKIERCMQIAYSAKVNSGCISRQVGAVLTDKDYNILSIGWNEVPAHRVPCLYRSLKELQEKPCDETYSDLEKTDPLLRRYISSYDFRDQKKVDDICEGLLPGYCFKALYGKVTHEKEQKDSRAMHGEERAFHSCVNKKLAEGGCLFTTSSSCERCTIIANEYRIKKIYYIESYPGIAQSHVNASGPKEERAEFILFRGAIGVAYTKLYTPILPRKDELELRGIDSLYQNKHQGKPTV